MIPQSIDKVHLYRREDKIVVKPETVEKKTFQWKLRFDWFFNWIFNLISTIVTLTRAISGKISSKILFISSNSFMPGFEEQPVLFVGINLKSKILIISSYVSWNLFTKSSRSFYFAVFNSSSISFFWVFKIW